MEESIISIEINGLYGIRDFLIKFDDNKLILVGENGSGKTTVARIIYAVLSCNWDMLRTYPFDKIVINFSNDSIEILSSSINSIFSTPDIERFEYYVDSRRFRRNYEGVIAAILDVKKQFESDEKKPISYISRTMRGPIPYEYFSDIIKNQNVTLLSQITNRIQERFQSKILYLPTYRRIEEPLHRIFPEVEKETLEKGRKRGISERVIELVEFGMDDVSNLVEKEQNALKSFSQSQQNKLTLGYLGEIVSKAYDQSTSYKKIRSLSDSEIHHVLSRIDSSILSDQRKEELWAILNLVRTEHKHSYSGQVKIVCHYFMQLLSFDQDIKNAEQRIRTFQDRCNKYLVNNKLEYNSQEFTCKLLNYVDGSFDSDNEITFQSLSSGEKQIVSLFSHLYLSNEKSLYVFIDEPELSLSVEWQRTFLPDIVASPNCRGLFATTHSPFIFDNELEKVVHGINEFCLKG